MPLMPMCRYGNAVGAARAAVAFSACTVGEVVQAAQKMKVDVLLSVGVDLLRLVGRPDAANLRSRVKTLAVASAFRNRTTEKADIVLPIATWFEGGGTVLDAAGEKHALAALMSPPGGAMSAQELCARVAETMGWTLGPEKESDLPAAFRGSAGGTLEAEAPPAQGLQLVARADGVDFDLGSVSRVLTWPALVEPLPELMMNRADAQARGLAPRSRAVVRANGCEATARICTGKGIPEGMAAISAAFDETRPLFRRRTDAAGGEELMWSEAEVVAETER